jgi:predicted nucleotidyltransferase
MDDVLTKLDQNQSAFAEVFKRHGVVLAYLFGSQARGEAGPLSDVDIAVLFESAILREERFQKILQLMVELGNLLERDDVEVIDLDQASPLLRHRAYYFGKRVYSVNEATRVGFELKALRDYVDTEPLRRIKRRYVLQRFNASSSESS